MAIQKITADVIANSAVTADSLADTTITAAKLAGTLDLTGKTITIATASSGDNDTSPASTAFVQQEISALVDSSPDALNTLNELAAALGDDANFSTTVTNSIALKAPLASPDFTGDATFDTTTLVVDATNNRVGIGTSSPSAPLHVGKSGAAAELWLQRTDGYNPVKLFGSTLGDGQGFKINVNSNDAFAIDSSGNVGIGETNPQDPLHLTAGSSDEVTTFRVSTAGALTLSRNHAVSPSITTNMGSGIPKLQLNRNSVLETQINGYGDSWFAASGVGKVGIGTSSPAAPLDILNTADTVDFILTNNGNDTNMSMFSYRNSSNHNIIMAKAARGTLASPTTIAEDESMLRIIARGYNSGDGTHNPSAEINFAVDGEPSSSGDPSDMPGRIEFLTASNGTDSESIRMTIKNDGNVGIGTADPQAKLHVTSSVLIEGGSTDSRTLGFTNASGSTGWSIGNGIIDSTHNFRIYDNTAGAARVTVDGSGNVGIGTSTPSDKFHVKGTGSTGIVTERSGTSSAALIADSAGTALYSQEFYGSTTAVPFRIYTGTSERMRIDSSGHVIVGSNISTTESGKLTVYTDATNDSAIYGYRSTSYFRIVPFLSNGAFSSLANVNDSGLFFSDNLVIAKAASGYYGMIVAGNGNIHFGTESEATGSTGGASFSADSNNRRNLICATTSTGNLELIEFRNPNGTVGTIKSNGTSTSYNTSSDYRLKENVTYEFNALDRVTQLKPARFNFITDADTVLDGFLAHEVSDIVPEAVSGEKDETKEKEVEITPAQYEDDGETLISEAVMETRTVPVYQGIDQSKLVPLLTKAIQELKTELDAAKARITELEG